MPKRAVKWLLWQLAHANLVLAISTAAAVYLTGIVIGLPKDYTPAAILFLVTFALYNFNRQTDKREDRINHPQRVAFVAKYGKTLAISSVFAYVVAIWLSFYGGNGAQFMVTMPLVAVLLYSIKWIPKNGNSSRLKEFLVVKNLVVSGAWGITVVFLPVLYFEAPITSAAFFLLGFFILKLFINTVVFDMRDILGDRKEEVKSIPVVMGYEGSRKLMILLNSFSLLFTLILPLFGLVPSIFYLFILSYLYSQIYLLLAANKKNIRFVCDVIVDGEFAVVASLITLILKFAG